jgi:hypothetical protein
VRRASVRLEKVQRDGINGALINALREARMGSGATPKLPASAALDAFREITRLAIAAGAPRDQLVLIFNGEEDAGDDAGRKDLQ